MKTTRFIALALAILTASSLFACGGSEDETTAATTTAAPAATTTKAPAATTTGGDSETTTTGAGDSTDDPVTAETPATGLDLATLLTGTSLHSIVTDVAATGFTPYGDAEGLDKLFNGTSVGDKMAGTVSGTAEITWKTSVASTVKNYIVYTGNDSGDYGRLPYAWELSGSNDDGATWTVIDKVEASGVTKASNAPFGYTVDTPAAYTSYKFAVSACSDDGVASGSTALQMNELVLLGEAEGVTKTPETPVTGDELTALVGTKTALNEFVTDVTAENITLWGDGAATNLFDGKAVGEGNTKLGGNGQAPTVVINFKTSKSTKITHYVVTTGGDSGTYGRTPQSWVLYASKDDGATWSVVDAVAASGMPNADATPYAFDCSANNVVANTYKLVITGALARNDQTGEETLVEGANFDLQFNELELYGLAAG